MILSYYAQGHYLVAICYLNHCQSITLEQIGQSAALSLGLVELGLSEMRLIYQRNKVEMMEIKRRHSVELPGGHQVS